MSLVETVDLTKHFTSGSGLLGRYLSDEVVHAVDNVDVSIERGQTVGLVGESGCGKSTLGKLILGLLEPTSGEVRFDGTPVADMTDRQFTTYRSDVQMVFQNPQNSLNPKHTVGKILRKAIDFHQGIDGSQATELAAQYLTDVGLRPDHLDRYPHEFSGGQQQRIALARALSVEPEFIVLDEPVSALDVSVQAKILRLIDDIKSEYDLSLLFITHDLNVVSHVCDEVAVMYLGEIVEIAPTEDLFAHPAHPYTQALFDSITLPEPGDLDRESGVHGQPPSPSDPPTGCRFRTRCPEAMDECVEVHPELRRREIDGGTRQTACHLYEHADDER